MVLLQNRVKMDSKVKNGEKNEHIYVQGIRHLGEHESIVYVSHVDDAREGKMHDDESKKENENGHTTPRIKRKVSFNKEKPEIFKDSNDDVNTTDTNSESSDSLSDGCSGTKAKTLPKLKKQYQRHKQEVLSPINGDRSKRDHSPEHAIRSVDSYGLSPRIARRQKKTLAASPLVGSPTSSGMIVQHSVDKFGLSPGIKRKTLATKPTHSGSLGPHKTPLKATQVFSTSQSPSTESFESVQSLRSSTERLFSMPANYKYSRKFSIPQVPLDTEFIRNEEELEKLRFIKAALSGSPNPISPESIRNRSNTTGSVHQKPRPSSVDGRNRASSLDSKDKQYHNAKDRLGVPKRTKGRVSSANH